MKKPLHLLFLSMLISGLASCSGSGGGGGGGGTPAPVDPKDGGEALSKLSEVHKQNFENWKQQVAKACDASDAFGLSKDHQTDENGIDVSALLQKNGNSIVFSDDRSLAILSSYNSFSGTATTKVDETLQVNGQGYTISTETKREGSKCAVYLFGQKVYETYLAESFFVGTQWIAGKEAQSTSALPKIRTLGVSGAAEVVQHGIYSLIAQALRPSKEAVTLIAQKLGLNEGQATKLFRLSDTTSADSALRIENESSAVWSDLDSGNLIAQPGVLTNAFDGNSKSLALEVRLAVPEFIFGETKNTADGGNLKLALKVLILKKDETSFSYSAQSVDLQGVALFDQGEAVQCSRDRARAYVGQSVSNDIQPSVRILLSPCRSLYKEIEKISYENGLMKSLVPQIFAGVFPSSQFIYNGWDQVLSKLAREALNKNQDIRSELDPNSKTKIVGVVADHLQTLKTEIAKTRNLDPSKDVVFQMGLTWSFNGQIVTSNRMVRILQSIDNSIDTFKVSSERLLDVLSAQPNSSDDQLSFAQGLDATYKVEAMKALILSKDLSYQDFERDIFNQVLQREIAVDEFKDWSVRLSGIKGEITQYANIGAVKGDLVSLSVKWLKSGEASVQDLGPIYSAISNSLDPFEHSTKDLVTSLSESLLNNRSALDFARSISTEYKQLAIAIRETAKAAEYDSWGQSFFNSILQKRPGIEQLRTWNEVWTATLAFTQREKIRTQDEFGSTNEWSRKKVIDSALSELWSNTEFTGLEAIAEVARAKNSCDRNKGYSSLADCGGMSLFSKQKGMFFDSSFGGRYVGLSKDFTGYMNQLSGFDWISLRRTLVDEFFSSYGPIWSKCDQGSFSQKASVLKTQVSSIVNETDQFKKWDLEKQIKNTIHNCQ